MVIRVVKNLLAYILSVHPSLTRVQNLLNQARDFCSYTPTLNSSYNLHRTLKVILISFRSVFYGNMVDTDFFLNHALFYSFTNFRDTSDSHQLHVFLFSYKLPTCLFLGHSTARYGKIGL